MKPRITSTLAQLLAAAGLVTFPASLGALTASITGLQVTGSTQSIANFINDEGDVVGVSNFSNGTSHAFFYSGITSTIYDIPSFGGQFSQPGGLNAIGEVSGTAYTSGNAPNAFIYSTSTGIMDLGTPAVNSMGEGLNIYGTVVGSGNTQAILVASPYSSQTPLGTLGGSQSFADFINDNGQITGVSLLSGDSSQLAFYQASSTSSMVSLTLGGSSSTPTGINANGEVIGTSTVTTGSNPIQHGFIYNSSTSTMTEIKTLNLFNGNTSAEGINSDGDVVGYSFIAAGQKHAYLYSLVNSVWVMTDLGTLEGIAGNSDADSVNSSGWVVGTASTGNPNSPTDPFVWIDGQMTDLNSLLPANSGFSQLFTAVAINDAGQIIGKGKTTNGTIEAYILTLNGVSPVPEPANIGMMALGLMLLMVGLRKPGWRQKN
jgi:probable HAF family extracellular repeat protein